MSLAKNASKLTSKTVHVAVREKAQLRESETISPTKEWQNKQVADFSKLRLKFARHVTYVQKQALEDRKRHKLPSKTNEQGMILILIYSEGKGRGIQKYIKALINQ